MKKYNVTIHDKATLAEIGMVCVEAEAPDAARGIGIKLIEQQIALGRLDPNAFVSAAYEVYSLTPGNWD